MALNSSLRCLERLLSCLLALLLQVTVQLIDETVDLEVGSLIIADLAPMFQTSNMLLEVLVIEFAHPAERVVSRGHRRLNLKLLLALLKVRPRIFVFQGLKLCQVLIERLSRHEDCDSSWQALDAVELAIIKREALRFPLLVGCIEQPNET